MDADIILPVLHPAFKNYYSCNLNFTCNTLVTTELKLLKLFE